MRHEELGVGVLVLGDGSNRIVGNRSAAPTTGQYRKGDIVLNNDPAGTEYVGWICTVAGTPGTWKGFGALEA